jgi:hypothetical protein
LKPHPETPRPFRKHSPAAIAGVTLSSRFLNDDLLSAIA